MISSTKISMVTQGDVCLIWKEPEKSGGATTKSNSLTRENVDLKEINSV